MKYLKSLWLVTALFFSLGTSVLAVSPDEILKDPALEARARQLSANLRCMVCQNQSIDDSDATLAKDLRVLVRERLVAGDSDEQILDYLVSRYGEFVLLKPRFAWHNALLWMAPLLVLLLGATGIALAVRARRKDVMQAPQNGLSTEEQERLNKLLNSGD